MRVVQLIMLEWGECFGPMMSSTALVTFRSNKKDGWRFPTQFELKAASDGKVSGFDQSESYWSEEMHMEERMAYNMRTGSLQHVCVEDLLPLRLCRIVSDI